MKLDKIGYEYGACSTEQIDGQIKWFEIQYTGFNGVQKIAFEDQSQVWSFGYEIEGQAKVTKRYEFGEDKRWIGLHGVESADGIEKIGIITMNPTCAPIGGVIKEPEPPVEPEPEKPVEPVEPIVEPVKPVVEPVKPVEPVVPVEPVTPEEPVKEEESDSTFLIVLVLVGCVIFCIFMVFLGLFIRKKKLQNKLNLIDNNNSNSETNPDKIDWNKASEAN